MNGAPALAPLDEIGNLRPLAAIEADAIRFALCFCRGQPSKAAVALGIGRSTLYRKMREIGLEAGVRSP